MGSDFDIDKLNIILPEVDSKGNVIKPDYTKEPKEIKNRKERNNIIFDVFDSITFWICAHPFGEIEHWTLSPINAFRISLTEIL